jgi:hypothetical protein
MSATSIPTSSALHQWRGSCFNHGCPKRPTATELRHRCTPPSLPLHQSSFPVSACANATSTRSPNAMSANPMPPMNFGRLTAPLFWSAYSGRDMTGQRQWCAASRITASKYSTDVATGRTFAGARQPSKTNPIVARTPGDDSWPLSEADVRTKATNGTERRQTDSSR